MSARRSSAGRAKSSGTTQTRSVPGRPGCSLTASFSVTSTSCAPPAGQGKVSKLAWSGSGSRCNVRPAASSMAKNFSGAARPAAASTVRPRSSSIGRAAEPSPCHQAASGQARPNARTASAPGSGVLARVPVYSTKAPGRSRAGRGWRSGPAGRTRPLPAPRSSNTTNSAKRARGRCCRPSSDTSTSTPGWAAHSARAAATRSLPTHTGTPVRRWMSRGSSPTAAASRPCRTSMTTLPCRP